MSQENTDLILAIKAGDRAAFDRMCGNYYAPLLSYAKLFLNGVWALDIVQDVFANVWLHRENLDDSKSLYGYLLRSVFNQSVNYSNKHNHDTRYKSDYQESIERMSYIYADPEKNPVIRQIYSNDMFANMDACISKLPEKCQEVFRLSYIHGLSHKEISRKLGISVSTVENHIYSALKQLRRMIPKSDLIVLALWIMSRALWQ